MATLTNTKIKDTYDGLLKTTDNDVIGASEKVITDGLGNASVLSIGTGSASFSNNVSITGSLTASNTVTAGTVSVGDAIVHTGDTDTKIEFLSNQIKTTLGGTLEISSTIAGTIFYKDIEVNGLTIGKGSGDISTNTALGLDALLSNTSGAGNVSVGQGSLRTNTTGSSLVAVGKDALRSNTTGNYNLALGANTLQSNVDGDSNVAIGFSALEDNTTGVRNIAIGHAASVSTTTGQDNVSIGYQSIYLNSTGNSNTAVGSFSLRNNTASGNTAVGSYSLYSNIGSSQNTAVGADALRENTGSSNTAVGYSSLGSNTTGIYNTAVGVSSLYDNTTGSSNVAVGYLSLSGNTTGSSNTAVGNAALRYNTSSNNVAVGDIALTSNTSGNGSTALGEAALANNTTGSDNTAVGRGSLSNNGTGERNTALGRLAGDTITTGTNNLYLGYNADASAVDVTNEIVIGASTTGNGSNTATYGNSSITNHYFTAGQVNVTGNLAVDTNTLYVDAASNEVGIGTSSPAAILDVSKSDSSRIAVRQTDSSALGKYAQITLSHGSTYFGANDKTYQLISNGQADGEANFAFQYWNGSTYQERMRIDSSGNVGIGIVPTSVGNYKVLELNGTSTDGGYISLYSSGTQQAEIYSNAGGLNFTSLGATYTRFYTNGSERMRIDSSGNVGIGVVPQPSTDPSIQSRYGLFYGHDEANITSNASFYSSSWKYIGTGYATRYYANEYDGSHQWFTAASGTAGNAISFTERMRIDSSGNVGIGISPSYRMHIHNPSTDVSATSDLALGVRSNDNNTNARALLKASKAGTNGGQLTFSTLSANVLSERMRITSGGFLKASDTGTYLNATASYHELYNTIGGNQILQASQSATTNPYGIGMKFVNASPNNTTSWFIRAEDSTTAKFYVYSNGNVVNTNNSYGAISDAKLKENVTDASPKLEDLMQVKVRNFNYIGDDKKQLGVVAQELEEVFPSMIDESPDFEEQEVIDEEGNVTKERVDLGTTTKSVKYSVFVPMLIKAMQEQQEIINDLKARIETLENN